MLTPTLLCMCEPSDLGPQLINGIKTAPSEAVVGRLQRKEWVPFCRFPFEICKRADWQMHKSAHKHWAAWVMAAAWVLEGRHCGHSGLSGNIKWPSHGSPLAWVVWLVLVCADRDGYTLVPRRWVERMRVVAKGASAGQRVPTHGGPLDHLNKDTQARSPTMRSKYFDRDR